LSARQFGISESAARRAIDRELPHFNLVCEIDMEGLQISADLQLSLGGIAKPMQAEELVGLRFLPNGKMAA